MNKKGGRCGREKLKALEEKVKQHVGRIENASENWTETHMQEERVKAIDRYINTRCTSSSTAKDNRQEEGSNGINGTHPQLSLSDKVTNDSL